MDGRALSGLDELADRQRSPAPFFDPERTIRPSDPSDPSGQSLQPMSVLAMWVGVVQRRWAERDEARAEARRVAHRLL